MKYLSAPVMNVKDDLLKCWKQNKVLYDTNGSTYPSSNDDCGCQLVGDSLPSFHVLPFGLFNAPTTFKSIYEEVVLASMVGIYMALYGNDFNKHREITKSYLPMTLLNRCAILTLKLFPVVTQSYSQTIQNFSMEKLFYIREIGKPFNLGKC